MDIILVKINYSLTDTMIIRRLNIKNIKAVKFVDIETR